MILTLDWVDEKQGAGQVTWTNETNNFLLNAEKKKKCQDKKKKRKRGLCFIKVLPLSLRASLDARMTVRWFISWSEVTSSPFDGAADVEADESRRCLSVPMLLLLTAAKNHRLGSNPFSVAKSKIGQGFSVHKFEALVWPLPDEPMEMLCFSLSVLTTVAAGDWRTFLESLILPSVGSRPKYFTCSRTSQDDVNAWRYIWGRGGGRVDFLVSTCICCPTSKPKALGCLICERMNKKILDRQAVSYPGTDLWGENFLTRLWSSCELCSRTALMLG